MLVQRVDGQTPVPLGTYAMHPRTTFYTTYNLQLTTRQHVSITHKRWGRSKHPPDNSTIGWIFQHLLLRSTPRAIKPRTTRAAPDRPFEPLASCWLQGVTRASPRHRDAIDETRCFLDAWVSQAMGYCNNG